MRKKATLKKQAWLISCSISTLLLITLFLFVSSSFGATDSICAQVKIEIFQELTLERQGFDAHMRINNGLTNIALQDVGVDVIFTDEQGNPVRASSDPNNADALFFIRVDSLDKITNVDGTGVVQPSSSADIHWLIIPATGASRGVAQGTLYYVGAKLTYTIGGESHETDVSPDYIFVKPMPELTLDYFLPDEVYGDDAFTTQIEPPIPFSLGVRARNSGTGVAKNLKIDSAQPTIKENKQGLLIGFNIERTEVNGGLVPNNSLLANFGDIQPNGSGVARWIMTCTLSGKFVEFTADFSHSNELGGSLTSLLKSVNTHTLVRNVLVDVGGRDTVRDFLATDGAGFRIYESDSVDTDVMDQSSYSTLTPKSQSNLTYTLSTPVTAGFMYVQLPDPYGGGKILQEVTRTDGKRIKGENVWLSKTRRPDHGWDYFFNLFDVNTKASYTVKFGDPSETPQPPVLQFIADRPGVEGQQMSFIVQASDPDGTIPSLSASPLPALARFTDQSIGAGVFDWTPAKGQAGRYEVTFTASEGTLKTSQRVVLTIVTAENHPPFVPSSPSPPDGSGNIALSDRLSWGGGDPDSGDTVTYDVYLGKINSPLVKVSQNQSITSYTPAALAYGTTYYWKIVARDGRGAETGGPLWSFATIARNDPPVADAGPDQDVLAGQIVKLDGSRSHDPEGATITFLWSFIEVPAQSHVTNNSLSGPTSDKPQFTPDAEGMYRLRLVVNDGLLGSPPDEVIITAKANLPPQADAGPDQNVITGQLVTLNGSKSFDPEGAMINFVWTFAEVPSGSGVTDGSLSDKTSAKPEFTTDVNGAYRLRLIVNDGVTDSTPDEVVIKAATPNVAPNADAGPDQNAFTKAQVNLDGSKSFDPDNGPEPLSYAWNFAGKPPETQLTNENIAGRDQASASFIPDVDGSYTVRLSVNDGDLTSYDDAVITATTPNVPPNANAGEDVTIYLGQTVVLDGSKSSDPDKWPEPLSYQWRFVTVPTSSRIGNNSIKNSGTVSPSFAPDVPGTYVLELMVYDGQDAAFDNVALTAIDAAVTYPNGGETWPVGSVQTIRWTPSGFGSKVRIELSRDGGVSWKKLHDDKSNDGEYSWKVTGPATIQARIRVSDKHDRNATDMSDADFRIGGGTITVTSPNGGETWPIGSTQTIRWIPSGFGDKVTIELSRDGGSSWKKLHDAKSNDGAYSWNVDGPATMRARIRVSEDGSDVTDTSDKDFRIGGGSISVTSPNGGEAWRIGSTQTIRWVPDGFSDKVVIELSRDGGSSWKKLGDGKSDDGQYSWKVTAPATKKGRIRVTSTIDEAVSDMSDADFIIN